MFGSMVLEIAIGIIFVFLLLGLVISAACELISSIMDWRAKDLEEGIRRMLGDSRFPKMVPKNHESSPDDPAGTQLADDFYNHPLIKSLHQKHRKPSYIPAKTFVLVLLDIITPTAGIGPNVLQEVRDGIEKLPSSSLKQTLAIILNEANQDLEKFKDGIEAWFNNSMQRVSGWYKERTQYVNFFLAVFVVVGLNADSLSIVKALATSDTLRQAIVARAEAYVKETTPQQPTSSAPPVTTTSPSPAPSVSAPSPSVVPPASVASPSPTAPRTPASATSTSPAPPTGVASPSPASSVSIPSPSPASPAATPSAIDETKVAASEFKKSVDQIRRDVEGIGIPFGWEDPNKVSPEDDTDKRRWPGWFPHEEGFKNWLDQWFSVILYHFFGWLITIVAVSFGAPFWFDILGKIITIRSSGKRPVNVHQDDSSTN